MRRRRFRSAPGIFLVVVLIGMLGYLLGWSKALQIKTIEIRAAGNEAIVTPILIPKDLRIGLPIARVSSQRIKHDLASQGWIEKITIKRRWLAHDLIIEISERKPVAQYLDSQGATEYFDNTGTNFAMPNPPSGLPIIQFADQNSAARSAIATFLAAAPGDITANMSNLAVDQQNQIALTAALPGYKALSIAWGTASEISLKVQVLRQLLTLPENKKIVSVDLSNPLTPVVK